MTSSLFGAPKAPPWRLAVRIAAPLAPLLTCALLSTFRDDVTVATAVLVLVVWVVGAAATGDRLAGVLAAVSAGAWFDYFLTEPYQAFTIADAEDIEATTLLVMIGLVVAEVALWGSRQQRHAARRHGYLEGVLAAAAAVADGNLPTGAVLGVAARQITAVLGADTCRYVEGPVYDTRIAVLDHDGVVTRNGHPVDVERGGLPTDEYVAVLVRRGRQVVGHFLVTTTSHLTYPTREERRVAVLLADQVAAAV